jgi:hypothetical protein
MTARIYEYGKSIGHADIWVLAVLYALEGRVNALPASWLLSATKWLYGVERRTKKSGLRSRVLRVSKSALPIVGKFGDRGLQDYIGKNTLAVNTLQSGANPAGETSAIDDERDSLSCETYSNGRH